MVNPLKSKNLWIAIAAFALYWIVAPIIPRNYVFDFANAFSVAASIGVLVMYYPSVARAEGTWLWPFKNNLSGSHYFVLGVIGIMSVTAVRHTWNTFWRWNAKPDWMIDSLWVGFFIWITICIAVMHMTARGMESGEIPRENWRYVGLTVALGVAVTLLYILYLEPVSITGVR
jgi:hypothetical protein